MTHQQLHCLHWLKVLHFPGLYSHIAHSNDKDEAEILQPFKGAHPKQPKPRGGGKGKQPQQKPKNPPPQTI